MSAQQLSTINSIGFWDDGCWYWNLKWNRCMRNNDTDHLHSMLNFINRIDLHSYKEERKIQTLNGKGHYTIKLCSIISDRLIYPGLNTYNAII